MPSKKPSGKKDNTTTKAIGTGVGAVGGLTAGAAAGAAVGSAVMPGPGTAIGAGIGGLVGGLGGGAAGSAIADYVDPADEEKYWQKQYTSRPYYREGTSFEEYRPAYRYGYESAEKYPGKNFDEIESRLGRAWPKYRGSGSHLSWNKVRNAVRDAHDRTIQLHEERLRVEKVPIQTGEVDVRKEVVSEQQRIDVPVEREEVVITRRKVDRKAEPGDIGTQQEEIRIPVKEEKVKVTKEAVVTEEVDIGRRKVHDVEKVDGTVRHEELRVNEEGNARTKRTSHK